MKLAARWDTFWNGPKSAAEPTSSSTLAPATARAGSNVVYLSTPEPTCEPTPSFIFLEPFGPREIAKRHAVALVQHLINALNAPYTDLRTLPYAEVKKAYDTLCEKNGCPGCPWNTVAKYVNLLIRENGKPLKPYKDVIDPCSRRPAKARAYKIPAEMPFDWKKRLED